MKHFRSLFWLCLTLLIVINPGVASAITAEQKRVIDSHIRYFNTEQDAACGSISVNTTLLGSDNPEKGYRYFLGKGLQPIHAAAIIGNFAYESGGLNPTSFNPSGGGDGAYGIAQWRGGRQVALKSKPSYDTLPVQLDFAWEELQSNRKQALDELQKTSNIDDATVIFEKYFEGSGGAGNTQRIADAKDVLATYGADGSISASTVGSSQGCSGIIGSGQNTKYIDGFIVYSQYDPDWKDLPYSTSTIGESGCGPSAMAMIITALTGKGVTPVDTANYAASRGLYISGVGSSWSIGPVLAEHWGLKSTFIGADLAKIAATLQAGGLVITAGAGADPFTPGGHFIVIRGITSDGKLKVGDSGHSDTSDKEWDPNQLIANMRDGSVYAITAQ